MKFQENINTQGQFQHRLEDIIYIEAAKQLHGKMYAAVLAARHDLDLEVSETLFCLKWCEKNQAVSIDKDLVDSKNIELPV